MMMPRDASLDRYIDRVRSLPKLSREEEHEVALLARNGDEQAIHRLVEANLRYVVAIALQYRRYPIRMGDLIAEGSLGLMTAVTKFDPERGTRFVTYAGYWIRAFVLECVVRSTTMVGGGTGALRSKLFFRLRRERARIAATEPNTDRQVELLAEQFDTTPERMRSMLGQLDARELSLDTPVHDEGRETLGAMLQDSAPSADEQMDRSRTDARVSAILERAMAELDPRERYIVEQRMLADNDDEASLASLGRELGVSRERARQLESRAKQKLRKHLEAVTA
ncbi:MAG: sigma-70 family RNA polymerase sigma factor [Polyangiales bacterium]|nr:sigma-70 family RNA polymerase sigma factor [Sandaracinaceae bacterium]